MNLYPHCICLDIRQDWFDEALVILKTNNNCHEWRTFLYGA